MTRDPGGSPPVILVNGSDQVLVREYVLGVIDEAVGDGDRSMMVDDLTLPGVADDDTGDPGVDEAIGTALLAAGTMPFLTDRRVVVLRGCGLLGRKDEVTAMLEYLENPSATTTLVLVWDLPPDAKGGIRRSSPPKALLDAVRACGGRVDEAKPGGKVEAWVGERLGRESFVLDADAKALLVQRVGDDPDVLVGALVTMRGIFAPGQRITADDLEPALAAAGGVAPWIVTDAIEAGDPAGAVGALQRMLGPGGRHPLQVLASLVSYTSNMVALDGSGATTREQAHAILGGAPYTAHKALQQCRRLGSDRVAGLLRLVAAADLDLRGRARQPDQLVLEVLVARMASRSAPVRGGRRASR